MHATDSTLTTEYAKLAQLNPFRYRGYVYDPETGLYYLRSRYYNPVWGRFLNSDMQLANPKTLLKNNQFTYCRNNPIARADENGNSSYAWIKDQVELVRTYAPAIANIDSSLQYADVIAALLSAGALAFEKIVRPGLEKLAEALDGTASSELATSIEDQLTGVAEGFGQYKCVEAANAMKEFLKKKKKHSAVITLKFTGGNGFIVSDIRGGDAISTNGIHHGVMYQERVYCNVHPYGLPVQEWIEDFHGTGYKEIICVPF